MEANRWMAICARTGSGKSRATPGAAVGGEDHGTGAVELDKDLVGIAELSGIHGIESEVVDVEPRKSAGFRSSLSKLWVSLAFLRDLSSRVGQPGERERSSRGGNRVDECVTQGGFSDELPHIRKRGNP